MDVSPPLHYARWIATCSRVYLSVGNSSWPSAATNRRERQRQRCRPHGIRRRSPFASGPTVLGNWSTRACAVEREDDLCEAQSMIAAGEHEIARDELRWILEGCSDNIAAHGLLGDLALIEDDVSLARGHFGYAYQIGMKAIRRAGSPAPLLAEHPPNAPFFAAAEGLVKCLLKLEKRDLAAEAVEFLLKCDPRDPLKLRDLLCT